MVTKKSKSKRGIAIRDELQGIVPYQSFDKRVKARLNTNENPYPIPDDIAEDIGKAVAEAVKGANRYPSDEFTELREDLAEFIYEVERKRFPITQILAANGSNEIMDEFLDAFGGPSSKNGEEKVALSFAPTYSMYPQYCRDSFTKFVEIPRNSNDFSINVEDAKAAIKKYRPSIIIIANPNNPTGGLTPYEDIQEIVEFTESIDAAGVKSPAKPVVVLDEAYIDFKRDSDRTGLGLVNKYDNVAVVRTLSKAFSFAGVRLGYVIASEAIIDALRIVRLPYNLSVVTQAVARTALKYSKRMLQAVNELRTSRDEMYTWLASSTFRGKLLHVVPSSANFIQLGFPANDFEDAKDLPKVIHDYLLERDVQVRVVGPSGYFRVTIGAPQENAMFKEHFAAFLSHGGANG